MRRPGAHHTARRGAQTDSQAHTTCGAEYMPPALGGAGRRTRVPTAPRASRGDTQHWRTRGMCAIWDNRWICGPGNANGGSLPHCRDSVQHSAPPTKAKRRSCRSASCESHQWAPPPPQPSVCLQDQPHAWTHKKRSPPLPQSSIWRGRRKQQVAAAAGGGALVDGPRRRQSRQRRKLCSCMPSCPRLTAPTSASSRRSAASSFRAMSCPRRSGIVASRVRAGRA